MDSPKPLFDILENIDDLLNHAVFNHDDYRHATAFLKAYTGSQGTFNAYRREVERLLQWSWFIANKSVKDLRRADIEGYIAFCQSPPLTWIGTKKVPRFIEKNGERIPNPEWRPFVVAVSKAANRRGEKPDVKKYELSSTAIKDIFSILGSFYNFLIQE